MYAHCGCINIVVQNESVVRVTAREIGISLLLRGLGDASRVAGIDIPDDDCGRI
jgi:hypothetical protein